LPLASQDVTEFGACYCSLYVSKDISDGSKKASSIPERRNKEKENKIMNQENKLPVWRCKVCGYLCAREEPPELCPICKAQKERFEKFM
jgi:ferredoxin-thioredoxin reductase catalytic chain